jgi:hypothetical protein
LRSNLPFELGDFTSMLRDGLRRRLGGRLDLFARQSADFFFESYCQSRHRCLILG